MAEEDQTTKTTPLFAAFAGVAATDSGNNDTAKWLQNSSFNTDLSVINDAVAKYNLTYDEEPEEEEDAAEEINARKRPPQYEMVPSDASASSDEDLRRKSKKKKKRRKEESSASRASFSYAATLSSTSRKPGVEKWASSPTANEKEYYFDSRGDRDNLAFGSIYRMDVARYKLYNSKKVSGQNFFQRNKRACRLEGDNDVDALDSKLRSGGRYWSVKYAAIERHKDLKRMRVLAPRNHVKSSVADYIPLVDEGSDSGRVSSAEVVEESWEDEVSRKTKEFNKMTREHPQDESLWLAFAEFQDKVASKQSHKGARLQILEKKISILEKATEINPESEDLLISLMKAYQSRDSTDTLIRRWEKILTSNSGSCKLWKEFLRVLRGEFSRFKVSEIRKMYANAIQALAGACIKQHRQAHPSDNATSIDPAIVQLELGLVDVFIGLCRFEWQAGYQELATALVQAELEYSLFSPFVLSEQSKQRLFQHFWSGNGARIGEDGALGWLTWIEKEEEQRQRLISEEASDAVEEGGWTGWFDPSSETKEIEMPGITNEGQVVEEELNDELDSSDVEQKDDVESLLKALGIDAAAEADIKIKDTETWTKWSKAEITRDFDHWMPLRANSDQVSHEDDEQILSIILYEDVSDYLFSLKSEEARFSLVSQFIDFFEGRIAQWTCTNSSSWIAKILSLESPPCSLLEDLGKVHDVLVRKSTNLRSFSLELLLKSSNDSNMRTNMMKFLRNAILLCLKVFPKNYIFEEAALVAEELSNTRMNSTSYSVTPCRALAKTLLKNNRQDVLLCGVYAKREAFYGNIDHSRKVFDMALSSVEGLPLDVRSNASLLYFWYAEVELANDSSESSDSSSRAIHILSCLGSGTRYTPFKGQLSSVQQLRARQGFKDRIRMLSSTWAHGVIDDHSAAFISSAALFEELTSGWACALEILEKSFTMVLPERRRNSRQLEFLFTYYVRMLDRNHMELKLSGVWESIVKGLQLYPFNPHLHYALVEISYLYTSPNKLRWTFDDHCRKNPSAITWLYALAFEMSTGGSQHRIRGLFERALEDDKLHNSVILWRCFVEYERSVACNNSGAKRVFFRAIHACPWSKKLWLDGFLKLNSVLSVKELSDLQEVMREKELNLRTDIYEILLQDDEMDA
ncbi:uncharacterized protein LOC131019658 [Salvia miltiorrhiza]|uniref:uncharacterized protein LOC131019658 n=1 Tax=Salvia miltiorrhiza TaxID=226208 RepID=UPI0025AD9797|nr:uncharacterized protein LOC131019658 [Salvia miltiorrhiza]